MVWMVACRVTGTPWAAVDEELLNDTQATGGPQLAPGFDLGPVAGNDGAVTVIVDLPPGSRDAGDAVTVMPPGNIPAVPNATWPLKP
jgi:hypothetical protein